MQSKLHIDLTQGVVDIEGDADFVREMYSEVKGILIERPVVDALAATRATNNSGAIPDDNKAKKPKKRTVRRQAAPSKLSDSDTGIDPDNPNLLKDLDVSKLEEFNDRYLPKNNAERILVFAKFLTGQVGIESPTTDHFFTCFVTVKAKLPDPFSQAFRNASGKNYGYINYNSPNDIKVTLRGENHLNHQMSKRKSNG